MPSVPESVSAGDEPDPGPADEPDDKNEPTEGDVGAEDLAHLPAEHRETVQHLRRRIEQAVATIRRLRAENEQLRRRVDELEAQPTFPDDETVFALDDEPEDVKQRITSFIDAIDAYLEASADEEAADDPASDVSDEVPDA